MGPNPKFVVTLDGVDLAALQQQSTDDAYYADAMDDYDDVNPPDEYVPSQQQYDTGVAGSAESYNPSIYRPASDSIQLPVYPQYDSSAQAVESGRLPKNVGMVRPQPLTVEPVRISLSDCKLW